MKYLSLGQQQILLILAFILLGLLYLRFNHHPFPSPSKEFLREIVVEVSGEVRSPGIYIFQNPPTLKEAIEKAGGLKETTKFDSTSSTDFLETGTFITVVKENPQEIKIKLERMAANKLLVFSITLELNRVSISDLCLIPGIGESLAHKIVDYRKIRGGFRSVEELKNVKGIGEKKWKALKTFFSVKTYSMDGS